MCKCKVKSLSRVRLFATPWTVAYQTSPSMGLSRQEYWGALSFPSPGDLSDPGIEPRSPALQADALPSEPPGKPKGSAKCIPKSLQKKSLRCTQNHGEWTKKEEEERGGGEGKKEGEKKRKNVTLVLPFQICGEHFHLHILSRCEIQHAFTQTLCLPSQSSSLD